jgi:hypothetical protein
MRRGRSARQPVRLKADSSEARAHLGAGRTRRECLPGHIETVSALQPRGCHLIQTISPLWRWRSKVVGAHPGDRHRALPSGVRWPVTVPLPRSAGETFVTLGRSRRQAQSRSVPEPGSMDRSVAHDSVAALASAELRSWRRRPQSQPESRGDGARHDRQKRFHRGAKLRTIGNASAQTGLIRFRGHLSKGEYDGHRDGAQGSPPHPAELQ